MRIAGAGPRVVLLHPVGLDGGFWGALPGALAPEHTVAAIDLPGHGVSPDAERPGRMQRHVDCVAGAIEALGGGGAAVVGVSLGGMVAQNLALQRPDLVRALVLAGCPGAIPESGRAAILARGAEAEAGGMPAVLEATLSRWFTPGFRDDPAVARVAERLLADTPSNFAAAWEAVCDHAALNSLGAVKAPTLVIAGEADAATPIEAKRALAAALPAARLAVMAGAPHMMQIERSAEFSDLVAGFLAELRA